MSNFETQDIKKDSLDTSNEARDFGQDKSTGVIFGEIRKTDPIDPFVRGIAKKKNVDALQVQVTALSSDVSGKEDVANKDTTITLGTSDIKYPSQKAVKTYVDGLFPTTLYRARMTKGSGQVIVTETMTEVDFDTISYDTNNNCNLTTNSYTVPVTGHYLINSTCYFPANSVGSRRLDIYKNGSSTGAISESDAAGNSVSYISVTVSDILYLLAGDVITMVVSQYSGGNMTIYASRFAIAYLSGGTKGDKGDTGLTGGLDGPTPYIRLGMSGTQAVDSNSTVAFDTVRESNGMTRNGNGINLIAGKTYKLSAWVNFSGVSGNNYLGYSFKTTQGGIGGQAYTLGGQSTTYYGFKAPALMFYTPTVNTIVYVNIDDDSISTGVVQATWNTTFLVEQVVGMKGDKGDTGTVNVSDITFEGWTAPTLGNSWVNYDGGTVYETAGYCKDALGFVHLKGLVKSGTANSVAFTLPVGYRPAKQMIFSGWDGGTTTNRIDVKPNGDVLMQTTTNTAVELCHITFKAA